MMEKFLVFLPILISFFITVSILPFWIRKARHIGLNWKDMNKFSSKDVAGSGGIIVLLSFVVGVLIYVQYGTFIIGSGTFLIEILALLCTILLAGGIGFIDDLLGWQKGGMKRKHRLLLVLVAAIPLVAINAGRSAINLPFAGNVDLGIFYSIVMIPIGIIGASTTFNFLAGFNGLEAGNGILLMGGLGFVAFFLGNSWIAIVCLIMAASLLGFLIFNHFPAKVFPGDVLTYSVGSLIAAVSILGNFEKVAFFFFLPFVAETLLKLRGKLIKQSFAIPNKDGSLKLKYSGIYSLNHLSIYLMTKLNIKPTERKVVYSLWALQILVIIVGILIFREGIFL